MICSICQTDKNETEFNLRDATTGIRYKHCKTCQATARKESYSKNRNYYLAYAKKNYPQTKQRREEICKFLVEYKTGKPCVDCDTIYPHYVMDFDHLPGKEKCFQIAKHGKLYSMEKLLAEIAKCELICANCHRERTWQRKLADR